MMNSLPLMNYIQKINLPEQTEIENDILPENMQRSLPAVPSVASHKILDIAILDQKQKLIDLNIVKTHLLNEGKLTTTQIFKIINDGNSILRSEPNLLRIDQKCFIFGDIHGQFYDLVSIIDSFDLNKDTLLFLGDYVDRGAFGVETYLYLLLLKSYYPFNIYILRGNHESEKLTTYFTFKAECEFKYGIQAYDKFVESFKHLPVAAVVQNTAFCCHGGISPFLNKVDEINGINRYREIEYKGLFCDIFWADPHTYYDTGAGISWEYNDKRRCSVMFNFDNVKSFLDRNGLSMVIRAHEVQESGYRLMKVYKGHPSVVTIFSAPHYCDTYENLGAYIEFDMGIKSIKQFESVNHPFVINGFLDGINWSFPFIAEKIVSFAYDLFEELDKIDILDEPEVLSSKMALMRTEREAIDEFEKDESVECDLLSTVDEELSFNTAAKKDKENEAMTVESKTENGISPSLSNKILDEVHEKSEDIDKAIKDKEVEIIIDKGKETVKVSKKKKGICRYICG